jgi:hypothetical protein
LFLNSDATANCFYWIREKEIKRVSHRVYFSTAVFLAALTDKVIVWDLNVGEISTIALYVIPTK